MRIPSESENVVREFLPVCSTVPLWMLWAAWSFGLERETVPLLESILPTAGIVRYTYRPSATRRAATVIPAAYMMAVLVGLTSRMPSSYSPIMGIAVAIWLNGSGGVMTAARMKMPSMMYFRYVT